MEEFYYCTREAEWRQTDEAKCMQCSDSESLQLPSFTGPPAAALAINHRVLDGLLLLYVCVSVVRPHELSRKSVAAANLFTLAAWC